MKYALAAAAILAAASQAAYAGGNPFIAGFAQGFMQTQQPPPVYQPYYYSPPPAYISPGTQSQTYTFPNGRTMTCMTTGGITNCF